MYALLDTIKWVRNIIAYSSLLPVCLHLLYHDNGRKTMFSQKIFRQMSVLSDTLPYQISPLLSAYLQISMINISVFWLENFHESILLFFIETKILFECLWGLLLPIDRLFFSSYSSSSRIFLFIFFVLSAVKTCILIVCYFF
jgi:hypothetical protein